MSNLLVKRLVLVAISLVVGVAVTFVVVTIIPPPFGLGTTLGDYGLDYTIYTILSVALGTAVLLDKFMKTEILPR